jgi:hypothetical protein
VHSSIPAKHQLASGFSTSKLMSSVFNSILRGSSCVRTAY